jgi:peptide/nickel transport system ATP-binding protein
MPATNTLLSVEKLNVGAAGAGGIRPILEDISFDLAERQVLGVIGETGAGKTVLSRAVVSWLTAPLVATSGSVRFEGRDLLAMPDAQLRQIRGRQIAYIGSNPASTLDPTLPVGRQIVEKLRAIDPSVSAAEAREKVVALLAAVRIPSPTLRFEEYPHQYSGGMMQRALIVDALVGKPSLLVADNVTQPLDATVAAQILRLLRELLAAYDTAIVFVSSSLPIVREIADDILVLNKGRVVDRQKSDELVASPRTPYARTLIDLTPRIWAVESSAERMQRQPVGNTAPILSVDGVSRTYRVRRHSGFLQHSEVKAVRNVTFDVSAGDNFGVIGESGCGKSTLSRLLARLEQPDEGRIRFEGRDIATLRGRALLAQRRSLQLVLQDPYMSMPQRMTIGRIIEEPIVIHGLEKTAAGRRRRALAMMAEVGLPTHLYDQLPTGLSAGQRQRINIARAMILEPKLLILDETLSALDQAEQMRLLDLFERLQAQRGLTYVFISHDLAMVRRVCTRLAVMYLGEVVELAANHALFFDPGHPYSKALLSAAPTVEEKRYRSEDCLLDGEPPSPIDLPAGCGFAGRCPQAFERCRQESPTRRARGLGDFSACFLAQPAEAPPIGIDG